MTTACRCGLCPCGRVALPDGDDCEACLRGQHDPLPWEVTPAPRCPSCYMPMGQIRDVGWLCVNDQCGRMVA